MNANNYVVILAGGKGERLWPLSRQHRPKQLLSIDQHESLLQQTIKRAAQVVEKEHIFIVTTQEQQDLIAQHAGNSVGGIIAEPMARNTAPAIALTCLKMYEQNSQAQIAFLPADHFIVDDALFIHALRDAFNVTQKKEVIALLGVKPTMPTTGYGYIEYAPNNNEKECYFPVIHFHEKPTKDVAQMYYTSSTMLWNIGVFCARVSVFFAEFRRYENTVLQHIKNFLHQGSAYDACPARSFDHAILEQSKRVVVIPCDFTWSDVGNLDVFLSLHQQKKKKNNRIISINANNNLVEVNKKLVALLDIDNICVLETDDILLIARRDQTDKVKQVLTVLKEKNYEEYL